jgi:ribosomal protein S6E (S10)
MLVRVSTRVYFFLSFSSSFWVNGISRQRRNRFRLSGELGFTGGNPPVRRRHDFFGRIIWDAISVVPASTAPLGDQLA